MKIIDRHERREIDMKMKNYFQSKFTFYFKFKIYFLVKFTLLIVNLTSNLRIF